MTKDSRNVSELALWMVVAMLFVKALGYIMNVDIDGSLEVIAYAFIGIIALLAVWKNLK